MSDYDGDDGDVGDGPEDTNDNDVHDSHEVRDAWGNEMHQLPDGSWATEMQGMFGSTEYVKDGAVVATEGQDVFGNEVLMDGDSRDVVATQFESFAGNNTIFGEDGSIRTEIDGYGGVTFVTDKEPDSPDAPVINSGGRTDSKVNEGTDDGNDVPAEGIGGFDLLGFLGLSNNEKGEPGKEESQKIASSPVGKPQAKPQGGPVSSPVNPVRPRTLKIEEKKDKIGDVATNTVYVFVVGAVAFILSILLTIAFVGSFGPIGAFIVNGLIWAVLTVISVGTFVGAKLYNKSFLTAMVISMLMGYGIGLVMYLLI